MILLDTHSLLQHSREQHPPPVDEAFIRVTMNVLVLSSVVTTVLTLAHGLVKGSAVVSPSSIPTNNRVWRRDLRQGYARNRAWREPRPRISPDLGRVWLKRGVWQPRMTKAGRAKTRLWKKSLSTRRKVDRTAQMYYDDYSGNNIDDYYAFHNSMETTERAEAQSHHGRHHSVDYPTRRKVNQFWDAWFAPESYEATAVNSAGDEATLSGYDEQAEYSVYDAEERLLRRQKKKPKHKRRFKPRKVVSKRPLSNNHNKDIMRLKKVRQRSQGPPRPIKRPRPRKHPRPLRPDTAPVATASTAMTTKTTRPPQNIYNSYTFKLPDLAISNDGSLSPSDDNGYGDQGDDDFFDDFGKSYRDEDDHQHDGGDHTDDGARKQVLARRRKKGGQNIFVFPQHQTQKFDHDLRRVDHFINRMENVLVAAAEGRASYHKKGSYGHNRGYKSKAVTSPLPALIPVVVGLPLLLGFGAFIFNTITATGNSPIVNINVNTSSVSDSDADADADANATADADADDHKKITKLLPIFVLPNGTLALPVNVTFGTFGLTGITLGLGNLLGILNLGHWRRSLDDDFYDNGEDMLTEDDGVDQAMTFQTLPSLFRDMSFSPISDFIALGPAKLWRQTSSSWETLKRTRRKLEESGPVRQEACFKRALCDMQALDTVDFNDNSLLSLSKVLVGWWEGMALDVSLQEVIDTLNWGRVMDCHPLACHENRHGPKPSS